MLVATAIAVPLIVQNTKQRLTTLEIAQAKINHAQEGATPPTRLNQVQHGQTPKEADVNTPSKVGVVFTFHSVTPVNDQGKATFTYTVDADPPVTGTTTKQTTFDVGGFETRVSKDARVAVQKLVVTDFRTGIDKTQIASTGKPSKVQVISDIRHKINNQNARALISAGDLTITPDNIAKTVTIVINNHGPTKTIVIVEFESIMNYLDKLLEAIPLAGGAFVIPKGITSNQFDDYVAAMGSVLNARGKVTMNKFAEKYRARITSLTISNSFTSVGNWFQHFNKITSLTLGAKLQTIGTRAFERAQLTSLDIPDSVTTIGDQAFFSSPLTSLALGANLQTIKAAAFWNAQLTSLAIPDSVTTIEGQAFLSSRLTLLTLGVGLKTIGYQAFYGAQLSSLTIPASVTTIGNQAFQSSPLATITIFEDVTLGKNVFMDSTRIIRKARPPK